MGRPKKIYSSEATADLRMNGGVLEQKVRFWFGTDSYFDRWVPVRDADKPEFEWRTEQELYSLEHYDRLLEEHTAICRQRERERE